MRSHCSRDAPLSWEAPPWGYTAGLRHRRCVIDDRRVCERETSVARCGTGLRLSVEGTGASVPALDEFSRRERGSQSEVVSLLTVKPAAQQRDHVFVQFRVMGLK